MLFEDGAALLGVALAGSCIALTTITGNSAFDSIGSILIGNLLGAVAVFLVRKNQSLLLGQAAPPEQVDRVVNILLNCDIIKSVHEIKTISQGSTNFRFKAEVEFDGEAVARKVRAISSTVCLPVSCFLVGDPCGRLLLFQAQTPAWLS